MQNYCRITSKILYNATEKNVIHKKNEFFNYINDK